MEIGGGDGPDPPLRLRRECLRLVVARGGRDDLIAVFVDGDGRGGRQLRLLLRLLLDLGNLLPLG